jgi:cytochrome c oxidase cbb3-type subunit 3
MSEQMNPEVGGAGTTGAPQGSSTAVHDQLRPHAYDGIQEYDNPPPLWLTALFFGTMLFALWYVPYYLLGYALDFDTPQVALQKELKEVQQQKEAYAKAHPPAAPTDEVLSALAKKPEAIAAGQKQFGLTCAACHGPQAQGLIGPNLTDNAWLHGGKLSEIRKTIVEGVPAKGMVAWGTQLQPEVIDSLVAYIHSIQGSNPPNAKPPQGVVAANVP